MGYQDRRYDDRRPPDQGFWGRVFGQGDNFFSWAFKLFSVSGISVRIHFFFLIYVLIELISAWLKHDQLGVQYKATMFACLFGLVLLHEFGHCLACRRVGGEADEIVLWPLGGLAMCRPPNTWKSHLITTLGGPGVNVVLFPVFGAILYAMTGSWSAVFFDPTDVQRAFNVSGVEGAAGRWVFFCHYTNLMLLLFNVLLPMYPLDGGRILQELLWWRLGRDRSLDIAANVGFFLAIATGVFALVMGYNQLLGIAVFAGITCWMEKQNRRFMAETGPEFATAYINPTPARDEAKYKAALKEQQRRQSDEAEVDRILAKISAEGLESLSRSERKILQRDTERRRGGSA